MDQVTKVRQHFKREEWKSIISECRASGMAVKAWCKTHGIVEQTYYKNLKRLREEMIENLPAPIDTNICEKPTVFKKLEVQAPLPDTKAAVIILSFWKEVVHTFISSPDNIVKIAVFSPSKSLLIRGRIDSYVPVCEQ